MGKNNHETDRSLADEWDDNRFFIVAAMDDKVAKLFEYTPDMTHADRKNQRITQQKFSQALQQLCEVRKHFFSA